MRSYMTKTALPGISCLSVLGRVALWRARPVSPCISGQFNPYKSLAIVPCFHGRWTTQQSNIDWTPSWNRSNEHNLKSRDDRWCHNEWAPRKSVPWYQHLRPSTHVWAVPQYDNNLRNTQNLLGATNVYATSVLWGPYSNSTAIASSTVSTWGDDLKIRASPCWKFGALKLMAVLWFSDSWKSGSSNEYPRTQTTFDSPGRLLLHSYCF